MVLRRKKKITRAENEARAGGRKRERRGGAKEKAGIKRPKSAARGKENDVTVGRKVEEEWEGGAYDAIVTKTWYVGIARYFNVGFDDGDSANNLREKLIIFV